MSEPVTECWELDVICQELGVTVQEVRGTGIGRSLRDARYTLYWVLDRWGWGVQEIAAAVGKRDYNVRDGMRLHPLVNFRLRVNEIDRALSGSEP